MTGVRRSVPARMAVVAIRAYQRAFAWKPSPCRYVPSCSQYAIEAVETHGAAKGLWLAVRRISRCHPWGGHGYDPVPHRKSPDVPHDRNEAAVDGAATTRTAPTTRTTP